MTTWTEPATCIPAAEIRPLVADALESISGAIAREKSRVATIALLRAQQDMRRILDRMSDVG